MESMTTVNIEAEKEGSSEDEAEALDNPDLYFGEKARDKFWDFYKSERRFKDFTQTAQDIEDPRQAYFQTCRELGINPRAKLMIRDTSTPILEYRNVQLLDKSSQAVAQAIKRYQVPIE